MQAPVLPQITSRHTFLQKLRRSLDRRSMNLHGYVASVADRTRIGALASDYDIVWVLNARTPNILQCWKWPHAHVDLDDVPSTYLRTVANSSSRWKERWKAHLSQKLMHRRELLFPERFTTLSVCSQADRTYLGGGERIHVIPNGFERPAVEPQRGVSADLPRIGFIGLYSYAPNLEGMRWFLSNCWETIRRSIPGIRLRLIGRETDGPLKPPNPDVDALGWVADPSAEIATWSTMIVPINLGGGTRIKIAEAFSRKCPAVSTSLGAFGYEVQNGKHLLIADDAESFSRACIELVQNPVRARDLAESAWLEYLEKWTWEAISPKVKAAAEDCLRRSRS